jgi:hypothetical protein
MSTDPITLFENHLANNLMGEGNSLGLSSSARLIAQVIFDAGYLTPVIMAELVSDIANEQSLDLDAAVEVCANEIYAALEKVGVKK